MNLLVCIKVVPDIGKAKIDPITNNLIREGLKMIINPSDLCALKFALDIKDKAQEDVNITVISMGPPQAEDAIRETIQMGADRGFLIMGLEFRGSDTLATSYTLSQAIKSLGKFDLVLTGDKTLDGDTGQIGPELSEHLSFNLFSFVKELSYEDGYFKATRLTKNGEEVVKSKAPLLVTALKDSVSRPSKFSRGREDIAKNAEIKVLNAQNIELDNERIGQAGSHTIVKEVFPPKKEEVGRKIEGDINQQVDELISILKDKGVLN